jgi:hypothetical protein
VSRIGISITKSTPFRNSVQEFSNVYYYENGGGLPDESGATALIDELVALEKTFHSSAVTFVRGRCWSAGGSKETNNMIAQKNLSGTGAQGLVTSMDKERAYLVRWRAGSDSRGNPVYLRKWWHSCGLFDASVSVVSNILDNSSGFTSGNRTAIQNKAQGIVLLAAAGGGWEHVAKSGREADSSQVQAHQFLEHHQMGDMWRAT